MSADTIARSHLSIACKMISVQPDRYVNEDLTDGRMSRWGRYRPCPDFGEATAEDIGTQSRHPMTHFVRHSDLGSWRCCNNRSHTGVGARARETWSTPGLSWNSKR